MILIAFSSFNEHISEPAFIVSSAVVDLDAGVDNWNVPIFFEDLIHLIEWESFFVDGEIFIVDHVVDVRPDGVERDVVGFVVFDDVLQHGDVFVAPSALVHTETPEGWDCGCSEEQVPLFECDLRAGLAQQEPKVKDTANNSVLNVSLIVRSTNNDIHGVGVSQVVEMEVL